MTIYNQEFLTAYTVSNEYLRWISGNFTDARRVLTVAASGDQALFHRLAGATHIDTFDQTLYAKFIQEIKFAAIKHFNRTEYYSLVRDLNSAHLGQVCKTPHLVRLMPYMSQETVNSLKEYDAKYQHMFGAGSSINAYPYNMPTHTEYEWLKSEQMKSPNFILSDIRELHTHIKVSDAEYDLINTSNIFDYLPLNHIGPTLNNLTQLLKVGGKLIIMPQNRGYNTLIHNAKLTDENSKTIEYMDKIMHPTDIFTSIIVFQRTR